MSTSSIFISSYRPAGLVVCRLKIEDFSKPTQVATFCILCLDQDVFNFCKYYISSLNLKCDIHPTKDSCPESAHNFQIICYADQCFPLFPLKVRRCISQKRHTRLSCSLGRIENPKFGFLPNLK